MSEQNKNFNYLQNPENRKEREELFEKLSKGDEIYIIFKDFSEENGTEFKIGPKGYMNRNQVMKLFNMDEEAIRNYTKPDKCSVYNELLGDGMKFFKVKEYKELNQISEANDIRFRESVENTRVMGNSNKLSDTNESSKGVVNPFSASVENTGVVEKDYFEDFSIPNRGAWLFSPKAVHKIGCTIKDSSYRDFAYKRLTESVIVERQFAKEQESHLKSINEMIKHDIFEEEQVILALSQIIETKLICRRSELRKVINQLEETGKLVNSKLEEKIDLYDDNLRNGMDKSNPRMRILKVQIDKLRNIQGLVLTDLTGYNTKERTMTDKLIGSLDARTERNLTDILCKIYPSLNELNRISKNRKIKDIKDSLVKVGIWDTVTYTSPKGKQTINYVPSEKYKWMRSSRIGMFTNNGTSQVIKFSEYGEYLIKWIIENKITEFTEEEFQDYLIDILEQQ